MDTHVAPFPSCDLEPAQMSLVQNHDTLKTHSQVISNLHVK